MKTALFFKAEMQECDHFCFFVVTALFLLIISGCSSSATPYTYVRKNHDQSVVKKVAVLSFYNNTKSTEANKIVRGAFVANLVGMRKFKVEFPGNIKSFLISERIIVRTGVDLNTINLMGRRLGVDAVIIGRIEEFVGINGKKRDVVPVVSISARMVHVQTGKILWMAQHRRTGDDYLKVIDFGKVRSVGELTRKVVLEMIETMP
jgi:TolB-like protein